MQPILGNDFKDTNALVFPSDTDQILPVIG
jgi:hypothetical protein